MFAVRRPGWQLHSRNLSMTKRILAIAAIYIAASLAWIVLGATIFVRTNSSDSTLRNSVASLWGAPQEQAPPKAYYTAISYRSVTENQNGSAVTRTVEDRSYVPLSLEKSRVQAALHLDYRQKGLLWYNTYAVAFDGAYDFQNDTDAPRDVTFSLNFPTAQAIYDDVSFTLNGQPIAVSNSKTEAYATYTVPPHQTESLRVGYRSQGLQNWSYNFGDQVSQVKDFDLQVSTDFSGFDFPENTLSPTEERREGKGWLLDWKYQNLISGYKIGVTMPQKLQPGPLAGRISLFAPVSLLFFFFVVFVIAALRQIDLHPMNYFFLACGFFAFHLLMAYLVDHISVHAAFAICSAVSVFLIVSYLRLAVGIRFAALEAGMAQFVYLILFSYAFFFEGFTGLAVTIGAILTLFVVMQLTARIRWSEYFAGAQRGRITR